MSGFFGKINSAEFRHIQYLYTVQYPLGLIHITQYIHSTHSCFSMVTTVQLRTTAAAGVYCTLYSVAIASVVQMNSAVSACCTVYSYMLDTVHIVAANCWSLVVEVLSL